MSATVVPSGRSSHGYSMAAMMHASGLDGRVEPLSGELIAPFSDAALAAAESKYANVVDSEPNTNPLVADEEALLKVMRRVESDGHRRGWDRNPMNLFVVYARDDEATENLYRRVIGENPRNWPPARLGPYVAQPLLPPGQLRAPGLTPYASLHRFCTNVAYADNGGPGWTSTNMLRHFLRMPGVVAVATLYEAFTRNLSIEQGHEEEVARAAGNEVDYSTMPDSVEMRTVRAVDLQTRAHYVSRTRGDRPILVADEHGRARHMLTPGKAELNDSSSPGFSFGDYTNCLRVLVDMILGQTPPIDEYFQRYPKTVDVSRTVGDYAAGIAFADSSTLTGETELPQLPGVYLRR